MPHFYINNARDQSNDLGNLVYYGETVTDIDGINVRRFLRELAMGADQVTHPGGQAYGKAQRKFFAAVHAVAPSQPRAWKLSVTIERVAESTPDQEMVDLNPNARMAVITVEVPNNWLDRYGDRYETTALRLTIVGHSNGYPTTSGAPRVRHLRVAMSSNMGLAIVSDPEEVARLDARRTGPDQTDPMENLVVVPYNGTVDTAQMVDIRPSDEALAGINPRLHPFATVAVSRSQINAARSGDNNPTVYVGDDWEVSPVGFVETDNNILRYILAEGITADSLIQNARAQHRMWTLARLRNRVDELTSQREQAQAEHRRRAAQAFSRFRERGMATDQLIPTLPFVPHGLASSRRWGIEVESGGARGVEAPNSWERKGDGSLRSAWDGYREVQDFEPYDEEVQELLQWTDCTNFERHMPHEQYFDEARNEYLFRIRQDYLPASECSECGARTRTVRREPQTIVHRAQRDDCAEFVSPILVSMHSNGLEYLTTELNKQPQNNSAGVHVHVEARDLNNTQLATLLVGYDMMERFIDASYQRTRRDFCERRSADSILALARKLKRGQEVTTDDIIRERRYVTTNTHSLSRHGTVEFRAMGPVYDYNYLVRWAMFCREMVNLAAAGVTFRQFSQVKSWNDLLALFAKYGKEYLRASVYEMTGETGNQAALSKEGQPVTVEALTADLQAVLESGTLAFQRLGLSLDEASARLVTVNHELATV